MRNMHQSTSQLELARPFSPQHMTIMELNGDTNDVRNAQESRGYQKEMLEESLKKNIVVAVQNPVHLLLGLPVTDPIIRWIRVAVKPICASATHTHTLNEQSSLILKSAILRIEAELERCTQEQV
jgi:hypothetical protein